MTGVDALSRLTNGEIHRFADWPIGPIPKTPGIYTIWLGDDLLYVGIAGRGGSGRNSMGLWGRLNSHASGRRSGDQFCIYVCDRLVLPLSPGDSRRSPMGVYPSTPSPAPSFGNTLDSESLTLPATPKRNNSRTKSNALGSRRSAGRGSTPGAPPTSWSRLRTPRTSELLPSAGSVPARCVSTPRPVILPRVLPCCCRSQDRPSPAATHTTSGEASRQLQRTSRAPIDPLRLRLENRCRTTYREFESRSLRHHFEFKSG